MSFAATADTWHAIGGFCEEYEGYGGEDTDYGQRARSAASRSPGSAAHRPSISITRSPARPSHTCTTSCATPRSSIAVGAGGR
ncbi:glycosyltransferase family 2 protein [Streptomyces sp. NPDC091287]|uniref:glycosyltransferase family 2 protein n=1 Tax=Streptomyces sp. NPDC091287 TaxID=3365988 RepID=UPI00381879D0